MSEGMNVAAPMQPTSTSNASSAEQTQSTSSASAEQKQSDAQQSVSTSTPKTHKLTVNGKVIERSEADILKDAQKYFAADELFRESSSNKKYVDNFLKLMAEHDNIGEVKEYLRKVMGKDRAKKIAEDLLLEELEWNELPEAERRARLLEAENKQLKTEQEKEKASKREQEKAVEVQKASQYIDREIATAFKEAGIATDPKAVALVATLMESSLLGKGELLPAKEAIEWVMGRMEGLIQKLPKDKLRAALPKEYLDEWRKDEVSQLRQSSPFGTAQARTKSTQGQRSGKAVKMSSDEYFKAIEKKFV